jgi:short-subunit dehydrogenase
MAHRVALVTGASSGIGAATARVLAERGYTVGIVARRTDRLSQVLDDCRKYSADSRMWSLDLSDPEAAARFALEAWEALGGLDVLVNNAGVPMRRRVQQLTMSDIERVMRINFFSPVSMTLAVLPRMLERDSGCIVNVSSFAGRVGVTTEAGYCATKFALSGFTEALSADLADTGVRVRMILPGTIATELWDQPGNDPPLYTGELEPAESVGLAIADAIDSDRFEHYVPDMKAIVEMKTSDIDTFMMGMRDFRKSQEQTT